MAVRLAYQCCRYWGNITADLPTQETIVYMQASVWVVLLQCQALAAWHSCCLALPPLGWRPV